MTTLKGTGIKTQRVITLFFYLACIKTMSVIKSGGQVLGTRLVCESGSYYNLVPLCYQRLQNVHFNHALTILAFFFIQT